MWSLWMEWGAWEDDEETVSMKTELLITSAISAGQGRVSGYSNSLRSSSTGSNFFIILPLFYHLILPFFYTTNPCLLQVWMIPPKFSLINLSRERLWFGEWSLDGTCGSGNKTDVRARAQYTNPAAEPFGDSGLVFLHIFFFLLVFLLVFKYYHEIFLKCKM